jgi:hypothetical protein
MRHLGRALVGYASRDEALQLMAGRAVDDREQGAMEREWRRVQRSVLDRDEYSAVDPLLEPPPAIVSRLREFASRPDVEAAMEGSGWTTGYADVSKGLLSYARLVDIDRAAALVPEANDDPDFLVDLCLPTPRQAVIEGAFDRSQMTFTATSLDPNLRVVGFDIANVPAEDGGEPRQVLGFRLNAGSSFVQLTEYNGRWMVRDGYHRLCGL